MPFFYEQPERFRIRLVNYARDLGHFRWTVDTAEDLALVRQIYDHFGGRDDFSWLDVLELVQSQPDLGQINAAVQHKRLPPDRRTAAKPSDYLMPLITIFTAPKPFTDPHIDVIQRNAIRSWLSLGGDVEVILVGDEAGMSAVASEYRVTPARRCGVQRTGHPAGELNFCQCTPGQRQPAADLRQRRYPAAARLPGCRSGRLPPGG